MSLKNWYQIERLVFWAGGLTAVGLTVGLVLVYSPTLKVSPLACFIYLLIGYSFYTKKLYAKRQSVLAVYSSASAAGRISWIFARACSISLAYLLLGLLDPIITRRRVVFVYQRLGFWAGAILGILFLGLLAVVLLANVPVAMYLAFGYLLIGYTAFMLRFETVFSKVSQSLTWIDSPSQLITTAQATFTEIMSYLVCGPLGPKVLHDG